MSRANPATRKPYKATSLRSAQTEVRRLRRKVDRLYTEQNKMLPALEYWKTAAQLMARLSKGSSFSNPINAYEAESLRDRIMENRV